jgi:iron complex transport system permease protein
MADGGGASAPPGPQPRSTTATGNRPSPPHVGGPRERHVVPGAAGRRPGIGVVVALLSVGVVVSVAGALMLGPVAVTPGTAWDVLVHRVTGVDTTVEPTAIRIVWDLRLPRALMAAVVGGTLALAGTVLQALVRNPLADPTILGGSAGASLGAVSVLLLGGWFAGTWSLVAGAFLGSALAYGLTWRLATRRAQLDPLRLILAGIAVGYLLFAVTNLIVLTADNPNQVRSALFWSLGSVAAAQWDRIALPVLALVGCGAWLLLRARHLDALLFGDETAASLGVHPDGLRRQLFLAAALLTATATALTGTIGFVGLVVPHAVRLVAGAGHRRLLPLSLLAGAIFLMWADVGARTIIPPQELPIGIITALIGAPVFAVLLHQRLRGAQR